VLTLLVKDCLSGLLGRTIASSLEGRWFTPFGWVNSKTENLAPVASLVGVHHLRSRAGLVGPVSVYCDWVGYHVYLWHCTLRYYFKTWLESGPVTVDLTITVIQCI